eukprot:141041-Chlamydomonas_euryale.AAC.8
MQHAAELARRKAGELRTAHRRRQRVEQCTRLEAQCGKRPQRVGRVVWRQQAHAAQQRGLGSAQCAQAGVVPQRRQRPQRLAQLAAAVLIGRPNQAVCHRLQQRLARHARDAQRSVTPQHA